MPRPRAGSGERGATATHEHRFERRSAADENQNPGEECENSHDRRRQAEENQPDREKQQSSVFLERNGHVHLLASCRVTSGAASLPRARPRCEREACET